jgi:hypothetical protein
MIRSVKIMSKKQRDISTHFVFNKRPRCHVVKNNSVPSTTNSFCNTNSNSRCGITDNEELSAAVSSSMSVADDDCSFCLEINKNEIA